VNSDIRIGIIGLGIGSWHLKEFSELEGTMVTALADLDEAKLKEQADKFDVPHRFTDYKDLLASDEADAVCVCLPNFLHEPVSIAALEAGKHVLCEKPLAHNLESGQAIAAAARASDRVFMLAMKLRYAPGPHLVRRLLDEGKLGRVYYGLNRYTRTCGKLPRGWFFTKKLSGGGTIIDNGVHLIDLNWYMMGCPEPVEVMAGINDDLAIEISEGGADVEDFAAACIRFDNGALMLVESAWAAHVPEEIFEVRVLGTAGGAQTHPEMGLTLKTGEAPSAEDEAFESQFEHFARCIRDGAVPDTDIEAGIKILRMLDALYQSAEKGQAVRLD
jgi:predicted dehydrogenase